MCCLKSQGCLFFWSISMFVLFCFVLFCFVLFCLFVCLFVWIYIQRCWLLNPLVFQHQLDEFDFLENVPRKKPHWYLARSAVVLEEPPLALWNKEYRRVCQRFTWKTLGLINPVQLGKNVSLLMCRHVGLLVYFGHGSDVISWLIYELS